MSVNSRDNKALLWQLLSNHPLLKNDSQKFQSLLEYRVNSLHKNRFHFNNNLMNMNKEIIKQFANEIPVYNKKKDLPTLTKTLAFDKRLKNQQTHFNKFNKPTPTEIDFSDKTEDLPITNNIVDNTLIAREKELKNIMAEYSNENTAIDWLGGKKTKISNNLKIDNTSNIKIQPTIISNNFINNKSNMDPKKRVKFEISEKKEKKLSTSNLLSKFKKHESNNVILDCLKRIEDKQDKILAHMEDINKQKNLKMNNNN